MFYYINFYYTFIILFYLRYSIICIILYIVYYFVKQVIIGKGNSILYTCTGLWSWLWSWLVSPHVTRSMNPVIGCHCFPATEHHRPLATTKLYCSVSGAHGHEQLTDSHCAAEHVARNWALIRTLFCESQFSGMWGAAVVDRIEDQCGGDWPNGR